jgi:hypothetical protein
VQTLLHAGTAIPSLTPAAGHIANECSGVSTHGGRDARVRMMRL